MSKLGISRALVAIAVLVGVVALDSAPAFAAGAPLVNTTNETALGMNDFTANGTVNPNGAETTYKFEYGTTTSYGNSTEVKGAGGGTEAIAESAHIAGLLLSTGYHWRMSATNKYGTTVSSNAGLWTGEYATRKLVTYPAEYQSEGTLTMEIPFGGTTVTATCDETGSGVINAHKYHGEDDSHDIVLSNCVLSAPGGESCNVSIAGFELNGSFVAKVPGEYLTVIRAPLCGWWYAESKIKVGLGFHVPEFLEPELILPMTLSGEAHFGANPVFISISSHWRLTGENTGKWLGIVPE